VRAVAAACGESGCAGENGTKPHRARAPSSPYEVAASCRHAPLSTVAAIISSGWLLRATSAPSKVPSRLLPYLDRPLPRRSRVASRVAPTTSTTSSTSTGVVVILPCPSAPPALPSRPGSTVGVQRPISLACLPCPPSWHRRSLEWWTCSSASTELARPRPAKAFIDHPCHPCKPPSRTVAAPKAPNQR
jgi:hypothetical protein